MGAALVVIVVPGLEGSITRRGETGITMSESLERVTGFAQHGRVIAELTTTPIEPPEVERALAQLLVHDVRPRAGQLDPWWQAGIAESLGV